MAETPTQDVKALFKRWRSGDADAGVSMAQRFSDWYYAITVMRLGDQSARAPLERACQTFAQRIMDITNADELIDFAHNIVLEEVRQAGGRARGSDSPNAMTSGQAPSALIARAAASMPGAPVQTLHKTYTESGVLSPQQPVDALNARHALKVWLSQNAEVPFSVLPSAPALDQAPLPIYEAARLRNADEERMFEQWLLSDIDLCKDIAEFAVFAHAIRAGALSGSPTPSRPVEPTSTTRAPQKIEPPQPVTRQTPEPPAQPSGGGAGKFIALAVLGAVIAGLLILAKMFL
jgi:hypothetical protein